MARLHAQPVLAIGLCTVAAAILTACGSSKHASSSSSSGSGSAGSPGAAVPSGAVGSPADAATTAAVTTTFVTLFNGSAPTDQRLALLQGGDVFAQALAAQASSPIIKQTSATVSQVSLVSANQAHVVYTVSLSGVPALNNVAGTAVLINGTWKVSATTFCSLLTVQGPLPPACTQASVTALPS